MAFVPRFVRSVNKKKYGNFKQGQAVFREWPAGEWQSGILAERCRNGWFVSTGAGEKKCISVKNIIADVHPEISLLKTGVKVLAKWENGKFYPGVIRTVNKEAFMCDILFDDGTKYRASFSDIRVR